MRVTVTELRREIETFNRSTGLNTTLDCYKPGRQTLCRLSLVINEYGAIRPLTDYMTITELHRFMQMVYNVLREMRCLKI